MLKMLIRKKLQLIYDFIVSALKEKTKGMEHPFNPNKEEILNRMNYNWARKCIRGYFPTHEICDATKLILLISDFAFENDFECISTEEPFGKLIQSICKIVYLTKIYSISSKRPSTRWQISPSSESISTSDNSSLNSSNTPSCT